MTMTEREHVEAAQKALADVKHHLKAVQKINMDAGRAAEANAAFGALSALNVWHANVAKALLEMWPDFGSDVVLYGPGGR